MWSKCKTSQCTNECLGYYLKIQHEITILECVDHNVQNAIQMVLSNVVDTCGNCFFFDNLFFCDLTLKKILH